MFYRVDSIKNAIDNLSFWIFKNSKSFFSMIFKLTSKGNITIWSCDSTKSMIKSLFNLTLILLSIRISNMHSSMRFIVNKISWYCHILIFNLENTIWINYWVFETCLKWVSVIKNDYPFSMWHFIMHRPCVSLITLIDDISVYRLSLHKITSNYKPVFVNHLAWKMRNTLLKKTFIDFIMTHQHNSVPVLKLSSDIPGSKINVTILKNFDFPDFKLRSVIFPFMAHKSR